MSFRMCPYLKALRPSSSYCSSSPDSSESNLRRPGGMRMFQKRVVRQAHHDSEDTRTVKGSRHNRAYASVDDTGTVLFGS